MVTSYFFCFDKCNGNFPGRNCDCNKLLSENNPSKTDLIYCLLKGKNRAQLFLLWSWSILNSELIWKVNWKMSPKRLRLILASWNSCQSRILIIGPISEDVEAWTSSCQRIRNIFLETRMLHGERRHVQFLNYFSNYQSERLENTVGVMVDEFEDSLCKTLPLFRSKRHSKVKATLHLFFCSIHVQNSRHFTFISLDQVSAFAFFISSWCIWIVHSRFWHILMYDLIWSPLQKHFSSIVSSLPVLV